MASNTYTNKMFFNDVLTLIEESDMDDVLRGAMQEKALKALEQLEKRADYAKAHPRKSTAKGASDATRELAAEIGAILTAEPMTAAEINEALGADYSALRISGAAKFIPGIVTCKVTRMATGKDGLKAERLYTAYSVE